MAPVVVCVGMIGCGFSATAPGGVNANGPADAPSAGSDTAPGGGSGSDGGATVSDCKPLWMNGTVTFEAPSKMINQSSTSDSERDPWVSDDGRRLYYAFSRDNDNTDIYLATRNDNKPGTPFGQGAAQVNLNKSNTNDGRPALSPDEKTLVMASDRDTPNDRFDILIVTRTDISQMFATPTDMDTMANVNGNTLGMNHFDPFLSADGLHLYFAPTVPTQQHIAIASRADVNSAFSAGQLLNNINDIPSVDADPAVSTDDKIIVFSSNRPRGLGGIDLWYATRTDPSKDFGTPKPIPNVNSSANDGDPMLSTDGCTLYFASTRGSSPTYDLYSATVVP
jgi:Tol biopolymer transport system component